MQMWIYICVFVFEVSRADGGVRAARRTLHNVLSPSFADFTRYSNYFSDSGYFTSQSINNADFFVKVHVSGRRSKSAPAENPYLFHIIRTGFNDCLSICVIYGVHIFCSYDIDVIIVVGGNVVVIVILIVYNVCLHNEECWRYHLETILHSSYSGGFVEVSPIETLRGGFFRRRKRRRHRLLLSVKRFGISALIANSSLRSSKSSDHSVFLTFEDFVWFMWDSSWMTSDFVETRQRVISNLKETPRSRPEINTLLLREYKHKYNHD